MNSRIKFAMLAVGLLFVTSSVDTTPTSAAQYAIDYGNGYAQNVEEDNGFLMGEVYVISPMPTYTLTPAPAPVFVPVSIPDMIVDAANRAGLNPNLMLRIAKCESGFNPNAKNSRSTASGVFQFLNTTWAATPGGRAGLSVFDARANIENAMWLMKTYGVGQWECK